MTNHKKSPQQEMLDAAKKYILDAAKKNGSIAVDSVWKEFGGDVAKKAIRNLERDKVAGSWRRQIFLADGENFAFKQGKVRQAGIGRFGLFSAGSEPEEELGYFPAKAAQSVLDGDEVVAFCAKNQEGSWESFPTKLLRREKRQVLLRSSPAPQGDGLFWLLDGRSFSPAFDVDREDLAEPGEIVVADIGDSLLRPGTKAAVIERLGNEQDPGIESKVAWAARYGAETAPPMDEDFSDFAPRQSQEEIPYVTIDGASSKDFDDAVFAKELPAEELELRVGIADVSAFVSKGGEMDRYALEKMTSVYLPHKVIPMLSPGLANGSCSLNPNEKRPVLVCAMRIGADGQVKEFKFERAWIRSAQRLTYEQAEEFWLGNGIDAAEPVRNSLSALKKVAQTLRSAGAAAGRLDLGDEECEFRIGDNGKIREIEPSPRLFSHKVVEECMLAANRSAAKFIDASAGVFRNHFALTEQDRLDLMEVAKEMGLWKGEAGSAPKDLSDWMAAAKAIGEERRMRSEILARMSSARYEAENEGHFSLAAEEYCHFTSPIRRYADLVVHRLIKSALDQETPCYTREELADLSKRASMLSARAAGAEADARKQLLCEFASRQEGHEKLAEASSSSERGVWCKAFEPNGGWMTIYLSGKEMEKRGWEWAAESRAWSREGEEPIRDGARFRLEMGRVEMASRRIVAQEAPAMLNFDHQSTEKKMGPK